MALGYGNGYGLSYGLSDPTSLLVPTDSLLPSQNLSSNALGAPPLPLGVRGLVEYTKLESGLFTDDLPISSPSYELPGSVLLTYFDDVYNRFYVTPATVDFGIVVDNTEQPLSIWNAFLGEGSLLSIDQTSLNEISYVDVNHPSLPLEFAPLQERSISATATLSGPTDIEGTAYFAFTPGLPVIVSFTGTRGKLWAFLPNWAQPVRETWDFKTEILSSRAGREQRIGLRETPRKSLEYSGWVAKNQKQALSRALDAFQHVDHVVPDLPRHVLATEVVPASADPFTVSEIPDWLEPDSLVVMVNGSVSVLRYVDSIDTINSQITLKDVAAFDMPVGTYVCYAFVGNLDSTISTSRLTDTAAEFSFRFSATPGRVPYQAPPAATNFYAGREVFLLAPDWSSEPSVQFERVTDVVDYDRGAVARFNPIAFGSHITQFTFTNRDYAQVKELQNLFLRARGRRGEFFLPTWESDLTAKGNLLSGSPNLRVEGTDTYTAYRDTKVFKTVMIILKDGTKLFRTISNMYTVNDVLGNDTIVQMTALWPSLINVAAIDRISWMPLTRFATDSLTLEWLTDDKSRAQTTFQSLEYLAAEA